MMMKKMMIVALALFALASSAGWAQETTRKVKIKTSAVYPELARKMNVVGTVKLEVAISSSGAVTSVKPLGGHPLLIDAATKAMKAWTFEAGPESSEIIEFKF